jgi:alpha-tubulin suppressor-like RCC1 family protein
MQRLLPKIRLSFVILLPLSLVTLLCFQNCAGFQSQAIFSSLDPFGNVAAEKLLCLDSHAAPQLKNVKFIAAERATGCAILETGEVYCCGSGDIAQNLQLMPQLNGATQISFGDYHLCAVRAGQQSVTCVGSNYKNAVDPLAAAGAEINSEVISTEVNLPDNTEPIEIVSGGQGNCALTSNGRVFCWGSDNYIDTSKLTKLGDYFYEWNNTFGSPAQHVAASGEHVCVLLLDGRVTCFGNNSLGQLGNGASTYMRTFGQLSGSAVTVPQTSVVQVGEGTKTLGLGYNHSCAVTTSGLVKCWGDNDKGQLGDGLSLNNSAVPVATKNISAVVELTQAAELFTCARHASGQVSCWGDGYGPAPIAWDMKNQKAKQIAVFEKQPCLLLETKKIHCQLP